MTTRSLEEVAAAVNRRRLELGFSEARLREVTGLDNKTLKSLLTGSRWMQEENRLKVEAALQWAAGSIEDIRAGDSPTPRQPPAEGDEPIRRYTDEDLLAEVLRRMRGQNHVANPTETTRAPGQARQTEEAERLRRANQLKDGRGVPLAWLPKEEPGVSGHPGDHRRHEGGSR